MATDDAPPLYLQIAEQLAQLIRNGTLARGEKLPSVRELARQHGVAQTTVVQAYHWLEDARLITARPRSGFFVAARPVSRARCRWTGWASAFWGATSRWI